MTLSSHRYCLRCRYVLDGLSSSRCPECGQRFDADNPKTYATQLRQTHQLNRILPITLAALPFLVLEIVCVGFVRETAGEIVSGLFGAVVIVGNLVVFAGILLRRPRLTALLLAALVLVTCPFPIYWKVRLNFLESEAKRIIAYAQTTKLRIGSYPPDLSGYQFQRAWTASRFTYSPAEFRLGWWVVQPGVSHWYTPKGGFGYYPD